MKSDFKLSLIIPVYNEQKAIPFFLKKIHSVFKNKPNIALELIFINDGSSDKTLSKLLKAQEKDNQIKIIDLTRNFGKEAALSAGLSVTTGDAIVPIDVDLQHPPELILKMITKWQEGFEVVLAYRSSRKSDTIFKRTTARLFYKIHNLISKTKLPENVGDFRLMDKKVVDAINQLPESSRFMKGIFAWVGFKTCTISYVQKMRVAGETKFNGWKLWNFAVEGVTSFSTFPLRIWTYFGFLVAIFSFFYGAWTVVKVFIFGVDTPGFATIIVAITFLGGLQLMGIGVIGEYLGRTYMESKRRPVFLIRQTYQTSTDKQIISQKEDKVNQVKEIS